MQLNRDRLPPIDYAHVGALVALGGGLLLYTVAGHLGCAWQWLES